VGKAPSSWKQGGLGTNLSALGKYKIFLQEKNNALLDIFQRKFSQETCKNFSFFIECVKFKSLNVAF